MRFFSIGIPITGLARTTSWACSVANVRRTTVTVVRVFMAIDSVFFVFRAFVGRQNSKPQRVKQTNYLYLPLKLASTQRR
jgi:hypothetical protein